MSHGASSYVEADIAKIRQIQQEIKFLQGKIKHLRDTRGLIETNVKNYLKLKGEQALESEDLVVVLQQQTRHKRMQKDKFAQILRNHGLPESLIIEHLYTVDKNVETLKFQQRKKK